MAKYIIPIPSQDEPSREQRTVIDGVEYVLRFDYTAREDAWMMEIADEDGTSLMRGIKLRPNMFLTETYKTEAMPQGDMFATTLDNLRIKYDTVDGSQLWYFDTDE